MAPCESVDEYQHYSYWWMYDTSLYVIVLKDISFIVQRPVDLPLPLWCLHLWELANLFQLNDNLRLCGSTHRLVKSSDL